jgi:hypothetical protein
MIVVAASGKFISIISYDFEEEKNILGSKVSCSATTMDRREIMSKKWRSVHAWL